MKLDTFFEKFELFADAPNAVARMRELILQIAAQGRLVDPADNDEPVENFLRRIWADKSRSRTELADTEKAQPFELADHWRWVVLAEVAEFSIGKTPPRGDSSYWYPEDHSWVSIADMKHYGTINETKEKVSASAAQEVFRQRFAESGSILMSFKLTIGKVARAGIRCFHNEAIISLQPPEPELADYLFRFLPIFAALQTSNNAIKGSTLNKGLLTLLPIALPPLAEQKRIVAKVDELMALCDRLEAQQQERQTRHAALARASLARFADAPTPANLDFLFHPAYTITPADLRKSILTLAVQGKLVPQDPNDEPASELVARVATEKLRLLQAKAIKSETPLDPISEEEALFPIPDSWNWLRAGDLCRPISSGSTPDQSVFHPSEGIPYLKVYNIRNQTVDFDHKRQFIAVNYHEERMKRSKLLPGDVIMNIVGPPLGKVAIVPDAFPEWNCNQAISFFRPIFPEVAPYLYTFLKEGSFLQNIQLIGTAGQDNISVAKCKFIPISLPPLAEQRRIVAKVDQLMALVDQLEAQLAASAATAGKLMEAVVAELTAQA